MVPHINVGFFWIPGSRPSGRAYLVVRPYWYDVRSPQGYWPSSSLGIYSTGYSYSYRYGLGTSYGDRRRVWPGTSVCEKGQTHTNRRYLLLLLYSSTVVAVYCLGLPSPGLLCKYIVHSGYTYSTIPAVCIVPVTVSYDNPGNPNDAWNPRIVPSWRSVISCDTRRSRCGRCGRPAYTYYLVSKNMI